MKVKQIVVGIVLQTVLFTSFSVALRAEVTSVVEKSIDQMGEKRGVTPAMFLSAQEMQEIADLNTPYIVLDKKAIDLFRRIHGLALHDNLRNVKACCSRVMNGMKIIDFNKFLLALDEMQTIPLIMTPGINLPQLARLREEMRSLALNIKKGAMIFEPQRSQVSLFEREVYMCADNANMRDTTGELTKLRPVTVEEVRDVMSRLMVPNSKGEFETVGYHDLSVLNELEKQNKKLSQTEENLKNLQSLFDDLSKKVEGLVKKSAKA